MDRVRAAIRIVALIVWFLVCVPLHLLSRLFGESRWPRRFLAGVARICGADVRVVGDPATRRTLLIANHSSWLDIPILAGATGCAFVSKAEIQGHPVMRWIADQNATVYVERSERRAVREQADSLRAALERGQPLTIFPEGTVARDGHLLPFRPALLSVVAPPPDGVEVRPVAIDYGPARADLVWAENEPGLANALRLLRRPGRIRVDVVLLPPLAPFEDRKQLAQTAHDAIASALGFSAL